MDVCRALDRAGVLMDPSQLSRFEGGKRHASAEQAAALRRVLEIPEPARGSADAAGGESTPGARLRALRKASGLSLAQLADRMAGLGEPVGLSTLSRYETDAREMPPEKLRAAAAAVGATLADLAGAPSPDVAGLSAIEREMLGAFRADGFPGLMIWCASRMREKLGEP